MWEILPDVTVITIHNSQSSQDVLQTKKKVFNIRHINSNQTLGISKVQKTVVIYRYYGQTRIQLVICTYINIDQHLHTHTYTHKLTLHATMNANSGLSNKFTGGWPRCVDGAFRKKSFTVRRTQRPLFIWTKLRVLRCAIPVVCF